MRDARLFSQRFSDDVAGVLPIQERDCLFTELSEMGSAYDDTGGRYRTDAPYARIEWNDFRDYIQRLFLNASTSGVRAAS